MNPWAERWATAVWSQLGMCNPILCSACQLIQTSSLVHLASGLCKGSYLQSTTGSFPEMPWTCLRCQRNTHFAGWVSTATQGGCTCFMILSHRERMEINWKASLSLTAAHSLHRLKYSTGGFVTLGMSECWLTSVLCGTASLGYLGAREGIWKFDKLATFEWGLRAYVVYNFFFFF